LITVRLASRGPPLRRSQTADAHLFTG